MSKLTFGYTKRRGSAIARAIFMATYVLVASIFPPLANAALSPNPNPPGNNITVTSVEDVYNPFDNEGGIIINLSGILNNYSELWNGSIENNAYIFNEGVINNFRDLTNQNGSLLSNSGSLNNFDMLDNAGFMIIETTGELYNSQNLWNFGSLDNYGYLDNNNGGLLWNHLNLSNNAILVNHDNATLDNWGSLNNIGSLTNTGSLNNSDTGSLNNVGSLNNTGTLSNTGILSNTSTGTLTNTGTLSNSGFLDNSGTLTNSGSMYSGMYLRNSGSLTNSGYLDNYGYLDNFGYLNNSSHLNNGGFLYNESILENNGTLTGDGPYSSYEQAGYGQTINNGTMTQSIFEFRGGTISGNGTFNGTVNIAAGVVVTPGNSPGTLAINGDLFSSGDYVFQIAGAAPGQYDVLQINGTVTFSGGLITLELTDGYTGNLGDSFSFLVADSSSGWESLGWSVLGLGAGLGYEFAFMDNNVSLNITAVPEAQTYAMMLAGLGLVSFMARRRTQAAV